MLILKKDYLKFVNEFPCLMRQPVGKIVILSHSLQGEGTNQRASHLSSRLIGFLLTVQLHIFFLFTRTYFNELPTVNSNTYL